MIVQWIKTKNKQRKCLHENKRCIANLHGDFINHYSSGSKMIRSVWFCDDCGKYIDSEYLGENPETINFAKRYERKEVTRNEKQ